MYKYSSIVNYAYIQMILYSQAHLKQPNNQKKVVEFNFHYDLKPQQPSTNERRISGYF